MGWHRQRRDIHQPGRDGRALGLGIRLRRSQTNHHHLSHLHDDLIHHAGHVADAPNGAGNARLDWPDERQRGNHPHDGGGDCSRARTPAEGIQYHAADLDDGEYLRSVLWRCFGETGGEASGLVWRVGVSEDVSLCSAEFGCGGVFRYGYFGCVLVSSCKFIR